MGQFNVGDIVTLKSGSPDMTVVSPAGSGQLFCTWFDKSKKLQTAAFDPAALQAASKEDLPF